MQFVEEKYYFELRTILITGATGLIGRHVQKKFLKEGHTVRILSTNKKFVERNENAFYWNVDEGYIDERAFEGVEILVNLAGASIAGGLWTKKRKKLIYDSRILGTRLLADTCEKLNHKLIYYIGASAVGFYGSNHTGEEVNEEYPKGEGFLADVCGDWEEEHKRFEKMAEVFMIMRFSNVFAHDGGFLLPFMLLSKFGIRILFSDHREFVSWIHVEDVARFFSYAIVLDLKGTYNLAVSFKTWNDLQEYLYDRFGDQLIRVRLPAWLLKMVMGEMSSLMLEGNYVSGYKMEKAGFMPRHVELNLTIDYIMDSANKSQ